MPNPDRIYLDNAATSWPKPPAVYEAVDRAQRVVGAPAGRGAYAEAVEVSRGIEATRSALAKLLGASKRERIIFTANGTDSLNLAIHGLLSDGGHVVTTVVEHNSVLRPLRFLEDTGRVRVTRVECNPDGIVDPAEISAAIEPETKLVALTHASNVTGALQRVEEVGKTVRRHKALFLVDAAQSLGHVPIDVDSMGIDLLAAPGHKGLLGPLGTGILYIAPGIEERLQSSRQGGTGSRSEEDRQPAELPDKYESGNLNVPGILGLASGVRYLDAEDIAVLYNREQALTARLLDGLKSIDGVKIHGPREARERVGVVSINIQGYDPQEVATMLETGYRIQVRSGIQCAPLMHRALGTLSTGGTVRFSLGPFTTDTEIETAIRAVEEIASAALPI